jgi:two-component system, sensor histidine kinase and response regulator
MSNIDSHAVLGSTAHILIVENDSDTLEFLVRFTRCCAPQAEILIAKNGAEALDLLKHQPCDLIISDYQMPVMSGLLLLQAVRATESRVPFVLCSAEVMVKSLALQAGATAFCAKPFALDRLRQIIDQSVGTLKSQAIG